MTSTRTTEHTWKVRQIIDDSDGDHDWAIEGIVDLDATQDTGEVVFHDYKVSNWILSWLLPLREARVQPRTSVSNTGVL